MIHHLCRVRSIRSIRSIVSRTKHSHYRPAYSPSCFSTLRLLPHHRPNQRQSSLHTNTHTYTPPTHGAFAYQTFATRSSGRRREKKVLYKDTGHVKVSNLELFRSKLKGVTDFISLYWQSVKFFAKEINLAARLSYRIYLKGHRYTRSERMKMQRAAVDVMKVLPFVSMTLVVGTEITALLAARAIPNMLPQAFQPVAKKVDENLPKFVDKVLPSGKERELAKNRTRVEIADKLHELSLEYVTRLKELAQNPNEHDKYVEKDVHMITHFLAKTDQPEVRVTQSNIASVGPSFRRRMPLQQLSRMQLVRMAQYMNQGSELLNLMLPTFVLVRRLRMHVQNARADDKDIHFEGVSSLSDEDLQDACYARGLSRGNDEILNIQTLRNRLRNWIALSIDRDVPSSLLILSSALISRSQLKLEQEQGTSGLEASALQQRINELNAKITARTQQRDEAQKKLDRLLMGGGSRSGGGGGNSGSVGSNVQDAGGASDVDVEGGRLFEQPMSHVVSSGKNDATAPATATTATTAAATAATAATTATAMEDQNHILQHVHNTGGTVFDALVAVGVVVHNSTAIQTSLKEEDYLKSGTELTWEEFNQHFNEAKLSVLNSKEAKIKLRKEAIDKIEDLLK